MRMRPSATTGNACGSAKNSANSAWRSTFGRFWWMNRTIRSRWPPRSASIFRTSPNQTNELKETGRAVVNTVAETSVADELRRLLGADRVLDSHSDLAVYECDAFVIEKHCPNVAVFPNTTGEVAAIVKLCRSRGVSFVPRGAGTSLSGGGLPVGG